MEPVTNPRHMTRAFDDEPFGAFEFPVDALDSVDVAFEPATMDQSETPEDSLVFPATQSAIAAAVGLSVSTVHGKLSALASLHGKALIFIHRHGEKRVTREGYEFLKALMAAGSIKEYRIQLDASNPSQPAPVPQFHAQSAPQPAAIPTHGTPAPNLQGAHLTLVPSNGTPTNYSSLGFPIAQPAPLAYYQPSTTAHDGAAVVDLASQLDSILTSALDADFQRTQEEIQAVRSQRARLAQHLPTLRAKVAAKQAANVQAAIALDQEKKSLAVEAREIQDLAAQIGYSVGGLEGLF